MRGAGLTLTSLHQHDSNPGNDLQIAHGCGQVKCITARGIQLKPSLMMNRSGKMAASIGGMTCVIHARPGSGKAGRDATVCR
jgi:hypothetical protein